MEMDRIIEELDKKDRTELYFCSKYSPSYPNKVN